MMSDNYLKVLKADPASGCWRRITIRVNYIAFLLVPRRWHTAQDAHDGHVRLTWFFGLW
jgi:hypothetical protein